MNKKIGNKKICDSELRIIITDKIINYDLYSDKIINHEYKISNLRKNGFLTYDENNREIGLVYMSDNIERNSYGNAEILFFKKYKNEFGSWRIIKNKDKYLPYNSLESHLSKYKIFTMITSARKR